MIGDKSESVTELQMALKAKGYLSCNATGYFGTLTQAAVMGFQKAEGLKVDGKAGPITKTALYGSGDASAPVSEEITSDDNPKSKYVLGDKGDEVLKIQNRLKELEYYTYSDTTGYFGPVTETAVKRFQRTNKLVVDGIVGKMTYAKLFSSDVKYFTLYPKDTGDDVLAVQNKLKSLGYYTYYKVTGYYGAITVDAVRSFQKAHGLTADGVVGRNTRAAMFSDEAKEGTPDSSSGEDIVNDESSKADSMIEFAKTLLGKPYVLSSVGPNSFDCSGFVYYVMKNSGLSVSRYSSQVYSVQEQWEKISKVSDLEKGDLMFFRSSYSSSISHVGMYIGDGKLIHASSSQRKIIITDVGGYFTDNFVLGRRVLND